MPVQLWARTGNDVYRAIRRLQSVQLKWSFLYHLEALVWDASCKREESLKEGRKSDSRSQRSRAWKALGSDERAKACGERLLKIFKAECVLFTLAFWSVCGRVVAFVAAPRSICLRTSSVRLDTVRARGASRAASLHFKRTFLSAWRSQAPRYLKEGLLIGSQHNVCRATSQLRHIATTSLVYVFHAFSKSSLTAWRLPRFLGLESSLHTWADKAANRDTYIACRVWNGYDEHDSLICYPSILLIEIACILYAFAVFPAAAPLQASDFTARICACISHQVCPCKSAEVIDTSGKDFCELWLAEHAHDCSSSIAAACITRLKAALGFLFYDIKYTGTLAKLHVIGF